MPIALENLDDLDWKDLVDGARLLIPGSAPEWTDHNASDPGMTMIEAMAYCTDMLIYRVNRIGEENLRSFLTLLRGPDRKAGADLHAEIRSTVAHLQGVHRLVTLDDYQALVLAVNKTFRSPEGEQVKRIKVLASRNLSFEAKGAAVAEDAPGHVSLVILANRRQQPSSELLRTIREALEPARLLTTHIHVLPPRFVTISIRFTLVPQSNVNAGQLRQRAIDALIRLFDPLEGGEDGLGWCFGKNVYVSELYQVLAEVSGVDYVTKTRDPVSGEEKDELIVSDLLTQRLIRNGAGDLDFVRIEPDELVALWIDEGDLRLDSA